MVKSIMDMPDIPEWEYTGEVSRNPGFGQYYVYLGGDKLVPCLQVLNTELDGYAAIVRRTGTPIAPDFPGEWCRLDLPTARELVDSGEEVFFRILPGVTPHEDYKFAYFSQPFFDKLISLKEVAMGGWTIYRIRPKGGGDSFSTHDAKENLFDLEYWKGN